MQILRRTLVVLVCIVGFLILVPMALLILDWAIRYWFPAHSIETHLDKINTTIRLDLYVTSPIGKAEYARRLIVASPQGIVSRYMGDDWGGATRTSIYLTERNEIAVLGPAEDDYLISFNPLRITNAFRLASDKWEYIGAFDRGDSSFRFFSPEDQSECIPTMGGFDRPALIALNTIRRGAMARESIRRLLGCSRESKRSPRYQLDVSMALDDLGWLRRDGRRQALREAS
jgi:hypothetical protein